MEVKDKHIVSMMRHQGHKITPQRRAILNVIARSDGHLTPAALYQRVKQRYPRIGLVTVYRTLDLLAGLGLICRVHTDGGCRNYLLRRPEEHHHHLICSGCAKVVDLADCNMAAEAARISGKTGFEIERHLVEFIGRCSHCRQMALAKGF